jgi:hypothetical protein
MVIEIVVHCYCRPGTTYYADALRLQHGFLLEHPSSRELLYNVFFTIDDCHTVEVVRGLKERTGLQIKYSCQPKRELYRRAIGRNKAWLETKADLVIGTDSDYVFGPDALDVSVCPDEFCWPRRHWREHPRQDLLNPIPPWERLDEFYETKSKHPLGGMFFVGGQLARRGYLEGTRSIDPVSIELGFRRAICDRWYRKWVKREAGISAEKRDIPGVYRLYHPKEIRGRDYHEDGNFEPAYYDQAADNRRPR